jgi:succinate dehydrogenase/fumarate reductase flavoprotein subunit
MFSSFYTKKQQQGSAQEDSQNAAKEVSNTGLSRRDFLLSGAVLGVTAVGAGALSGCSPRLEDIGPEGSAAADGTESPVSLPGAQPIAPLDPPSSWDKEADLVVVGLGGGGLAAALLGRQKGASVIAVDKLSSAGGSTQHAGVFINYGGSRYQNAIGFAMPSFPFNPEALAASLEAKYLNRVDPKLLRQLIKKGPECIDWMGDEGVDWDFDPQFGPLAHCWKGSCDDDFYPMAMKPVTDHMFKRAQEAGAEMIFDTTCNGLYQDKGRIVGLKVTNLKGESYNIKAKKAVILTAGGFAVNFDMLKTYAPSGANSAAAYIMPCDTGECTRMALGVDADMTGFDSFTIFDGGIADYEEGTGPFQHYLYSGDNQLSRQPWLGIDIAGNRYPYHTSEPGTPTAHSGLASQAAIELSLQGHRAYVIFDADYETNIFKLKQAGCRRPILPTMEHIERMPESFAPHDWKIGVQNALDRGAIKKADTLEGLAEELGLDPAVLKKSVDDWNAMCAAGVDPEFDYEKDFLIPIVKAPYYGIKIGANIFATHAGVRVNTQMQVMNTKGKSIPGLYAGFHTAGGALGEDYWGMSVLGNAGLSFTSGFIAAENAANELSA